MPSDKQPLIEAALNLVWSHWTALGVRGAARAPDTAVDPEALLYLTSCLIERDPRLRDEVVDWWSSYEKHISHTRLSALKSRFGERTAVKLGKFLETLQNATRTSGKSRLVDLNTPARSLLRMRSVFGANARAEILLELLTRRAQLDYGATSLSLSEVGYSKRNIAFIVENLVMGGFLLASSEGNRVRYRLSDPDGLERVLRPLPSTPGRWHFRLPIVAVFVELAERLHGRDAVVQGIEAKKTLESMMPNVIGAGITASTPTVSVDRYWPELQRWIIDNVIAGDSDSDRRIERMIEGVWLGPRQEAQRPERYTSAVLPRVSADPMEDDELLCVDLVQVPTVEPANDWVWAVLSTAATTTYAHTIGLDNHERWRFVTWAFGKPRTYLAEYGDSLPHGKISRLFGETAAGRARPDYPAVQLRLKLLLEE